MADWGANEGAQHAVAAGVSTAASAGTAITAPGAINTKGAFTQLSASSPVDAAGILISASINGAAMLHVLVDIAVGAASSEQVIVADLHFNRISSNNMGMSPVFLPIAIPAGSRISARYQSSDSSAVVNVSCVLVAGAINGPQAGGQCVTYGAVGGASKGTTVDPGATANTKGAFVEMVAATPFKTNFLTFGMLPDATVLGAVSWLVDIAIGPSGSEQVVIPNVFMYGNQSIATSQMRVSLPFAIPAGSRVSMRAQCSSTATGRALLFVLHAIG